MDEHALFNLYHIKIETVLSKTKFAAGGYHFHIVPAANHSEEEIHERMHMANHLHSKGELGILIPLQNQHGKFLSNYRGSQIVLLGVATSMPSEVGAESGIGLQLATFHYRGRYLNNRIDSLSRIGQWKDLWERRIDQIEKFWQGKCVTHPQNEFERMFIEYFPYYLGLGENAIQYLVDTEKDDYPGESDIATICHDRFCQDCFGVEFGKNLFDLVYDHPIRDLAEWSREQYNNLPNTYHYEMQKFFQDYFRVLLPSNFTLRLLYARLLLPINFLETVETYFTSQSENIRHTLEDKLHDDIKKTSYYEKFLKEFFELVGIPKQQLPFRVPEWLI